MFVIKRDTCQSTVKVSIKFKETVKAYSKEESNLPENC